MASEFSCVQVPTGESKEDFASQQQPWLLITDWKNCHIQNSMFNTKPLQNCYYDVGDEIPEFFIRYIGSSCGEWVLLIGSYDDGLPHVLVNLLSKETIELPLMDFKHEFCILTSDPTCQIVFFNRAEEESEEQEHSLIIWQPGDREFTIKKWDYEIFPDGAFAVVAGKLFLNKIEDGEDVLIMVEFKEFTYRFEVIQMDPIETKFMPSCMYYFFEYSGELFAVYKINCGSYSSNLAGFKIFKADLLNKKWVRINNLGRLAIFIGYSSAHCAAVDSGMVANSIYFLEEDDLDSYYVYSLEDGTIRMKPILCSMETTEHTRQSTRLDWIMMPGHLSFPKLLLKDDQESIRQDPEKENKASGEVEEDEVQESWNMVPPEVLNLIQLRLLGRDNAVFRGVCKAWQQASVQDYSIPSLLSSKTLLEQCQSSSPLLMYQEDLTSSYDSVPIFRFFDPVHRKLYRTRIPDLKEADIQNAFT